MSSESLADDLGSLPAGGGLALAPLAQTAGVTCLSHCQWRFEESGTGHGENRDLTGKPGPPSQGRRLPLAVSFRIMFLLP